jgi:polyisoprenoid-binding protein YceI
MRLLPALIGLLVSGPLAAEPLTYRLDNSRSEVGFQIDMGKTALRGLMPVSGADLLLDFDRAAASRVSVTLDAGAARMGLPFATEAMRGASVLDARAHPEIRFESTRVRATGTGATVEGLITIRGVTRPVTLDARLYRPKGSVEGDRRALSVRLTGQLSRRAFGAAGFADLVGDTVRIDILARVRLDEG